VNAVSDISARVALDWLRSRGCVYPRAHLRLDSRAVEPGDVFIAVPGVLASSADGRSFIETARARGAAAVIAEAQDYIPPEDPTCLLPVAGLRAQLGSLAASFYGAPSEGLLAIGVTGTNGKTSCSRWIAQLLSGAGRRCAVIGTVGCGFTDGALEPADLTTPDPVSLQYAVRRFADEGAQALAMEVSSIGLEQGRADGMDFDIALFTNLTRDHLDYHGTMAAYEAAKARLFDWPTLRHAVVNLDDAAGLRMVQRVAAHGDVAVIGTTLQGNQAAGLAHRLSAEHVHATPDGISMQLSDDTQTLDIELPLVGMFNAANVLGVAGVALACGIPLERACNLLALLTPPAGRMQRVATGAISEPLAVIDYAHTPDALVQALGALRTLAGARNGKLWVVFGAGGDRDPGKRAPMGEAAALGADCVVITSDNPRREDPAAIVAAVFAGVPPGQRNKTQCCVDRAAAIALAISQADAADVLLIAGKGHEEYQDAGGLKRAFSDVEHARAALAARRAHD